MLLVIEHVIITILELRMRQVFFSCPFDLFHLGIQIILLLPPPPPPPLLLPLPPLSFNDGGETAQNLLISFSIREFNAQRRQIENVNWLSHNLKVEINATVRECVCIDFICLLSKLCSPHLTPGVLCGIQIKPPLSHILFQGMSIYKLETSLPVNFCLYHRRRRRREIPLLRIFPFTRHPFTYLHVCVCGEHRDRNIVGVYFDPSWWDSGGSNDYVEECRTTLHRTFL